MKYLPLLLGIFLFSCETSRFDADKRQVLAKNEIRSQIKGRYTLFDIESFKQDTLPYFGDSTIKNPIRYTLNFQYSDSAKILLHKTGEVIFTPDGNFIIASHIK